MNNQVGCEGKEGGGRQSDRNGGERKEAQDRCQSSRKKGKRILGHMMPRKQRAGDTIGSEG